MSDDWMRQQIAQAIGVPVEKLRHYVLVTELELDGDEHTVGDPVDSVVRVDHCGMMSTALHAELENTIACHFERHGRSC